MSETITLTREEIRGARGKMRRIGKVGIGRCGYFLDRQTDPKYKTCLEAKDAYCRLCKRLTEFAKGGE